MPDLKVLNKNLVSAYGKTLTKFRVPIASQLKQMVRKAYGKKFRK